MTKYGYAGKILKIDLSRNRTTTLLTSDYAQRFLGGRGIAAKIYWDEVAPETKALHPENCLIVVTGPLAGFTGFSGCRWQICGKSPEMDPESFSYANLGGSWGAWLKYAGYDGLVVTGKAEQPIYILITDHGVQMRDASHLWGKTAVEARTLLRNEYGDGARVLDIGIAGEHQVAFATTLASENASGSSGFGAVMGSKNLKAIVIRAEEKQRPLAFDQEKLRSLAGQVRLLRASSFEDYGHILPLKTKLTACYGCISGCTRGTYRANNGEQYKHFCQAMGVYAGPAKKYYGDGLEVSMLASRLCDDYGLDTAVMSPLITWLDQCYAAGILSEAETGLPLSRLGSSDFIEILVKKISFREGFGDILAGGTLRAAGYLGKDSQRLIGSSGIMTRAGETRDHDPRLVPANALLWAMEPRRAVHLVHAASLPLNRWLNWRNGRKDAFLSTEILQDIARKFWGSSDAGDYSTNAGKALAAKKIQEYGYIKESLILCDLAWPVYPVHPVDNRIGPFILESQILSAITGQEITPPELFDMGERIFNLQRAVLMRQGWRGRKGDDLLDYLYHEPLDSVFYDPECLAPDKSGNPVSRKGTIIERDQFEKLKDEYYALRGWDVESGFQTKTRLEQLGLREIAKELEKHNLVKLI